MTTVLQIDSSPLDEDSVSRQLTREFVERLRAGETGARVIHRDLGGSDLPHLTRNAIGALRGGQAANDEQQAAATRSDALLAELEAADIIVIGSPMYNFGITSQLKAWFDHVLRPGKTFRYTEKGPEGLLKGKRAVVIESRGGIYSQGPYAAVDHQEPHLRTLLGFMGVTDVQFVHAEGLGMGPESRERGLATARAAIDQAVTRDLAA